METYELITIIIVEELSTDPTYKEWKPVFYFPPAQPSPKHGSYLQGMETKWELETDSYDILHSTDPTYKEWKPLLSL